MRNKGLAIFKLKLIVIYISVFPFVGFSQSAFSVGASFNTQLNRIEITNSLSPSGISEKGEFGRGYSIGVQVQKDSRVNLFFRSGLIYQHLKY